jgi:hypothetical protein
MYMLELGICLLEVPILGFPPFIARADFQVPSWKGLPVNKPVAFFSLMF